MRGDLDTVLAKALAKDPARRYASVELLANDLKCYQTGYPVLARPDSFAYRLRKSIGRHRFAAIVAGILGAGLVGATIQSTWQARLAERRFEDLRAFAHTVVFDVNDALAPIAGTTAARKLVVETALRYLDRLFAEGAVDTRLREELAEAYIRVGKVQGGAFLPNLGDAAGAMVSFRKAIAISGVTPTPALERSRIAALISIAQLSPDPIEGAPEFAEAVEAASRLLTADASDASALRLLADAYHGLATLAHLTNDVPRHVDMATRQIATRERLRALGALSWSDGASLARAIAQLALGLEQRGDYGAALAELERAQVLLESTIEGTEENQMLRRGLAEVRSRKTPVLLALGRTEAAATEAQAAISMLEPLVATDPANVQYPRQSRLRVAEGSGMRGGPRAGHGNRWTFTAGRLAVRRERAERHAGFIFVPWELTRSLNSVADPPVDDDAAPARGSGVALRGGAQHWNAHARRRSQLHSGPEAGRRCLRRARSRRGRARWAASGATGREHGCLARSGGPERRGSGQCPGTVAARGAHPLSAKRRSGTALTIWKDRPRLCISRGSRWTCESSTHRSRMPLTRPNA